MQVGSLDLREGERTMTGQVLEADWISEEERDSDWMESGGWLDFNERGRQ